MGLFAYRFIYSGKEIAKLSRMESIDRTSASSEMSSGFFRGKIDHASLRSRLYITYWQRSRGDGRVGDWSLFNDRGFHAWIVDSCCVNYGRASSQKEKQEEKIIRAVLNGRVQRIK